EGADLSGAAPGILLRPTILLKPHLTGLQCDSCNHASFNLRKGVPDARPATSRTTLLVRCLVCGTSAGYSLVFSLPPRPHQPDKPANRGSICHSPGWCRPDHATTRKRARYLCSPGAADCQFERRRLATAPGCGSV